MFICKQIQQLPHSIVVYRLRSNYRSIYGKKIVDACRESYEDSTRAQHLSYTMKIEMKGKKLTLKLYNTRKVLHFSFAWLFLCLYVSWNCKNSMTDFIYFSFSFFLNCQKLVFCVFNNSNANQALFLLTKFVRVKYFIFGQIYQNQNRRVTARHHKWVDMVVWAKILFIVQFTFFFETQISQIKCDE